MSSDGAPPTVEIPLPLRRPGKALIYLFFAFWILWWTIGEFFPTATIPGTGVSISMVFFNLWFVTIGIIVWLVFFLALYAARITNKNAVQKATAAGHKWLAALVTLGYVIAFVGGAALLFLFGIFIPVGMLGPQPDVHFINFAPVFASLTPWYLFQLGIILAAIGGIIAAAAIILVYSEFDPKVALWNFLKRLLKG